AALLHGEVAPTRQVMSSLTTDEALLEYLVGDSTTVLFVVRRDTLAAFDLKISHNTLAAQVDFARSTLASAKEGAGRPARPPSLPGVLGLAARVAALPGSRAEVAAIARIFGTQARVLVGPQATESAFRMFAPDQGIVHLATFGVLNKRNPLFSFVELGPGENQDGRLEVHEVFGLTLNARLLVLSACQTGLAAGALADVPPGDDWVGLVNGFLYA